MATQRWRGDAPAVLQLETITFGTWDATTNYKFTINGKIITALGNVSGATTATTLATAFLALLNATTIQEFKEITWANPSAGVITGTGPSTGKPFTLTTTVVTGTGTFTSNTVTTASTGPNDVSNAANWVSGALPATGDDIIFDGGADVLYNLATQIAITPATITVFPSFTGKIGLPEINVDNASANYQEYRKTYLQYGTSGTGGTITVTVNGGAGRIKIDNNNAPCVWIVNTTGQRIDNGVPACLLKSTNASVTLDQNKGDVGIAFFGGEIATLSAINLGYQTNPAGDSRLWIGRGVTLTGCAIKETGGALEVDSLATGAGHIASLTQYAGTSQIDGSALLDQLTMDGGTCVYNSSGTLGGNTALGGNAVLDFSRDIRTKTITNPIEKYGTKAAVLDPNQVCGSIAIGYNQGADPGVDDLGVNFRLTRSSTP